MKLKFYSLLSGIALLASSCSHGFYYKPDPSVTDQSNTVINSGVTYAVSNTPATTVVLSAEKPAGEQLHLRVLYMNNTLERADAIPEYIKVYTLKGKKVHTLKVFNADQYIGKLQRKQNFAMAMQSFSNAYNNQKAGYSASSTTASAYSSNGTYVSGSANTVSYDAGKVSEANARSNQQMREQAMDFNNANQSFSQRLIRDNTLVKGQAIAGLVIIDTSKSFDEEIYVEVPFGNDKHTFALIPNK